MAPYRRLHVVLGRWPRGPRIGLGQIPSGPSDRQGHGAVSTVSPTTASRALRRPSGSAGRGRLLTWAPERPRVESLQQLTARTACCSAVSPARSRGRRTREHRLAGTHLRWRQRPRKRTHAATGHMAATGPRRPRLGGPQPKCDKRRPARRPRRRSASTKEQVPRASPARPQSGS
jgi:hypothetical protein